MGRQNIILLPSPHPVLPLTKHFFLPGFVSPIPAGLLREEGLSDWLIDSGTMHRAEYSKRLRQRVFLFAYDQCAESNRTDGRHFSWRAEATLPSIQPPGRILNDKLKHWCGFAGRKLPGIAAPVLEFDGIQSFVSQTEFDAVLLYAHDMCCLCAERIHLYVRNGQQSRSSGKSTRNPK